MKNRLTAFHMLLCIFIFLLTFAGKTEKLEEFDNSFKRSQHYRPEFTEFEGMKFGITYEEFKRFADETESLMLLKDTTVDRGHRGRHRIRVYLPEKGNAGSVLGNYYLFGLDFLGQKGVHGYAYFTPGEERLHRIILRFPDRVFSNLDETEVEVRKLYDYCSERFGMPDYLSGRNNDDWGPQKEGALTKKNLNHPSVKMKSVNKTFAGWYHPEGKWAVRVSGRNFEHDKNRYQVLLKIYFNYTKGF